MESRPLPPFANDDDDDDSIDPLIVREARRIADAYKGFLENNAQQTIHRNLDLTATFNAAHYIPPLFPISSKRLRRRHHRITSSLASIPCTVDPIKSPDDSKRLPYIDKIARYQAWVPTIVDHYVADEDIEPFVPYFGDSRNARKRAQRVYKDMRNDINRIGAGLEEEVSDGELRSCGNRFRLCKEDSFDYLCQRRRRQIERFTILKITRQFGTDREIWASLSHVLGKGPDLRRVMAIHRIASVREKRQRETSSRRQDLRRKDLDIRRVLLNPLSDNDDNTYNNDNFFIANCAPRTNTNNLPNQNPDDESVEPQVEDKSLSAMRHFCFTCHVFACEFHHDFNVRPVIPIPDKSRDARVKSLKNQTAKPCDSECFLDFTIDLVEDGIDEFEEQNPLKRGRASEPPIWQPSEVTLFREAKSIFGDDWCSIAVVIGSKTCQQVHQYHLSQYAASRRAGQATCSSRSAIQKANICLNNTPKILSEDEADSGEAEPTEEQFIPCSHDGPCLPENDYLCRCVQKGLSCESSCGCNNGRYGVIKNGVGWVGETDCHGRPVLCKHRHGGCSCGKHGVCNSNTCHCYVAQRACNPDLCGCDCIHLPQFFPRAGQRRCRNIDIISARHKRVYVGRSSIHGFGLFTGQSFRKGDLLGPYCGRVMDSNLLDSLLRKPQAEKLTFAFNLTRYLTVDAGLIGSKVKFINHADNKDKINCMARVERVRGECRICIKAIQNIKAGQEFLMDYKIVHEEGNSWLKQNENDDDEEDGDECVTTSESE